MTTRRLIIGIIIVIALVALSLPKILKKDIKTGDAGKNQMKNAPVLVSVYVVKPEKVSNIVMTTGTVLANEEIEIHSEIAGKITGIFFKEGGKVRKGDLLLKIYDMDLQAQLKKLELQKSLNEKNEARQKQLLAINGISQQEYDNTLNLLNSTKADIDLIKAQLQKTEIRAPFAGTIGLKSVSNGAYVMSTTKIASLQQTDTLKVDFSIPEKYMDQIGLNDEMNFTVQGSSKIYSGKIMAIEPKIDPDTRNILVRAICRNADNNVFPGAFASVKLILSDIKNALMIPSQAVIPELKGQKIFLVKNGKATPSSVQLGVRNDIKVQITDGVANGDTVIITGIFQVKPDGPVKVMKVQ